MGFHVMNVGPPLIENDIRVASLDKKQCNKKIYDLCKNNEP